MISYLHDKCSLIYKEYYMLKLENKKDIILELLDSGLNTAQIAKHLDEYQQAVRNVIKKYRPKKSFMSSYRQIDGWAWVGGVGWWAL